MVWHQLGVVEAVVARMVGCRLVLTVEELYEVASDAVDLYLSGEDEVRGWKLDRSAIPDHWARAAIQVGVSGCMEVDLDAAIPGRSGV